MEISKPNQAKWRSFFVCSDRVLLLYKVSEQ